jgi:hypothetical protein
VTHRRRQQISRAYSRQAHKSAAALAIDDDLIFDAEMARTAFGEDSIAALMAHPGPEAHESQAPATPQSAVEARAPKQAEPRIRLFDRLMAMIRRAR